MRRGATRGYVIAAVGWALLVTPLTFWGIPTDTCDELLFGGPAWSAEQFRAHERLDALRDERGADVDRNPLDDRSDPIVLTATRAQRAEILTRYRLYSRQPDEMITFRALQQMNPRAGDLDPKLYQYGGVYIYGVGATLAAGHLLGLLHLTGDLDHYLEHPRDFGHFYAAARMLSVAAGAVLLVALALLARRIAGRAAGWLTLVCVAACPVFLCGALEAKPHLPSAAALAVAMLLLDGHLRRPSRGRLLAIAVLSGLAFGLVLTGLVGAALCAATALAHGDRRRRIAEALVALLVFGVVYAACNPYLVWNQLFRPELVQSNLGNSTAMYVVGWRGFARVAELLYEGCGPFALIGILGWLLLARRHGRGAWLVSSAALGLLLIGGLLGAGKPAEFARFLVLPACGLALCSAVLLTRLAGRRVELLVALAIVLVPLSGQLAYAATFLADRNETGWRIRAGSFIDENVPADQALGVVQEPAPYSIPPLDFTRRAVVLLPEVATGDPLPAWLVLTCDDPRALADRWWWNRYEIVFGTAIEELTPITWANKATYVLRRRDTGLSAGAE